MPRSELDALLSADRAALRDAERLEFDRRSRGRDVVLMGAGRLGRRALIGMRSNGVEPLAFCDNSPERHGSTLDGVAVLSPAEAAARYGARAAFVVTIWGANSPHRFAHSREQLQALGCDLVLPFPPLFWKYAEALLPFYLQDLPSKVLDEADLVGAAMELWEDAASRAEYLAQVRLRIAADFDGLAHPVAHPQYFPPDLYAWRPDESIVDGGAFDGDTIRTIRRLHDSQFSSILALEPDPVNFAALVASADTLPPALRQRVDCRQVALSDRRGTLYVEATGTLSSAAGAESAPDRVAVAAERLDDLVEGRRVTFIKLDIEGAEIAALHGARRTIAADAPVLAVCVYHLQNHLWRIPLLLRQWRGDYALFLRPHNEEGWDLVCYAVPRARLSGLRRR